MKNRHDARMRQAFRWIWNAGGGALQFWAIVGLVHAWLSEKTVSIGTYSVSTAFLMQTYAAVAVGVGIFLVLWNRHAFVQWRQRKRARRPEARFTQLSSKILDEVTTIEHDKEFPFSPARSQGVKFVSRQKLNYELSCLGIEAPVPAIDSDDEWYRFLVNLLALSQHGRIEEARTLLSSIRQKHGKLR